MGDMQKLHEDLGVNKTIEERFGHFFRGKKLNLGCGPLLLKGDDWVNADLYIKEADLVFDFRDERWPIEDGAFDTIFASHVFEHFSQDEIIHIVAECGRILKPMGCVIGVVPYGRSRYHYANPFHKFGWTEGTPALFDKRIYTDETGVSYRRGQGLCMYPWSVLDMFFRMAAGWAEKPEAEREFAIRHYQNVIEEMFFVMRRERE